MPLFELILSMEFGVKDMQRTYIIYDDRLQPNSFGSLFFLCPVLILRGANIPAEGSNICLKDSVKGV